MEEENFLEFFVINLYEFEGRVFVEYWFIFYKKEELFGKCFIVVIRLVEVSE